MARLQVRRWNPKLTTLLTPEATTFLAGMHQCFAPVWGRMTTERQLRQRAFLDGKWPKPPAPAADTAVAADPEDAPALTDFWQVAAPPLELADRRVETMAPAHDRAALAAAWNAGAGVVIADLDDLFAPTWANVVQAHRNLRALVRQRSEQGHDAPALTVRPRGLHILERQVRVEGDAMPAGLFDAGLFLFHHARPLLGQGMSPHLVLPKIESAGEARLWHRVLADVEDRLSLPTGTVRVTVQIESVPAVLEMEAILHALRERAVGLHAGRSDYLADWLRRFGPRTACILPYQGHLSPYTPFLRTYAEGIIACAHRHGAAAIGSMIALVPDFSDSARAGLALAGVRDAITDAALLGFDGAWVAHSHLVPVVRSALSRILGTALHQRGRVPAVPTGAARETAILQVGGLGSVVTEDGVRESVAAALTYLTAWLGGEGLLVRAGRAEDTATAEVARMQLWQWLRHGVKLVSGRTLTPDLYRDLCAGVQVGLLAEGDEAAPAADSSEAIPRSRRVAWAQEILDRLVLADACVESWPAIAMGYLE